MSNLFSDALNDPQGLQERLLGPAYSYSDGIKTQVKANTYLEESNRGLATTFSLNRESAADFMHELRGQATTLGIGDEKLASYAGSLDGLARGFINASTANSKYVKDMMQGQTIMTVHDCIDSVSRNRMRVSNNYSLNI